MKILLVSHHLSITGAPLVLLWVAKFLKSKGHNIDLWTLCDGPMKEDFITADFNPILVDNNKREIYKLYQQKRDYDLIIANTICTYKCVDVLQRFNTPIIWYIHETKLVNELASKIPDCADILKNFYNIYTVSNYSASVLKKYNPNVKFIKNGVKDEFKDFAPLAKHLRFGFIGSIIPVKGIDLLIEAFIDVLKDYPSATLDIAGHNDQDFARSLKEKTKNIPNIRWLGVVQKEEKESFFNNIDVLCTPSIDDPCPLTVLEGAMLGKIIITTDKAGSNYVVDNGNSGFVVPAGSVDDLSKAIKNLCSRADIFEMQQKSREVYLKEATIEQYCENILKMLSDNKNNMPIVKTELKFERWIFNKEKSENGQRTYYLFGIKIFSYHKKQKGIK